MTNEEYYSVFDQMIEDLQTDNREGLTKVISSIMNISMRLEQEKAIQASHYERNDDRVGHRNGYKSRTLRTRVGEVPIEIPQVRGMEFYPESIEKGCRSERALKAAIAQMYIQGVSTRRVTNIVEQLCGFQVSQSQVSEATAMLDEEITKWRNRPLGAFDYLVVDATYEKTRVDRTVVSAAVLIAYGVDTKGMRRVIGVSTELSEADVHWRGFLSGLVERGLHGIKMITSDAHSGLKSAREAIFPTVPWQRCQFHLQQNAGHHVPKKNMDKEVAEDIRAIFNAPNGEEASRFLAMTVKKYEKIAPALSQWMDQNIPESLTVFKMPRAHQKRLRTSNLAERQMKEIKRRTKVAMIFPNRASVDRLVSALLMEIDETWSTGKRYLKMETV
jgi:putative transposase